MGPLYKECKILKLIDNVKLQNFLFAYDNLKNNLPSSLKDSLSTGDMVNTWDQKCYLQYKVPSVRTQIYGVNSIKFKSVNFWNYISNKHFHFKQLHNFLFISNLGFWSVLELLNFRQILIDLPTPTPLKYSLKLHLRTCPFYPIT